MKEPIPQAPPPPLRNKLLSGSAWMLGLRWALRFLGAINIAILARLLTPEDFGIVAMATAIVGLSKVFFELGVDYALIRKTDATDDHFHAAWSIRLLQSLGLAAILVIAGPYANEYYGDDRVGLILKVIALSVIIQGITNIGVVFFRKELEFNREFHYLVTSKILSIVITIALAITLRSYWALVIGIVSASLIECFLSYVLHPFRPKFSFKSAEDIWSFSKWMIILQFSNYLTLRFDRLLLGGLVTPTKLGHYTLGGEVASIATTELVAPVSRAIVPGLAKLQHDAKRLRAAFLKTISATALITIPTSLGLSLTAAEIIPLALGEQWTAAIPIVQVASLHLLFASLVSSASNLTVVTGHIAKLVPVSLARSVLFLSLFYPAFQWAGVIGVLYLKLGLAMLWTLAMFKLVSVTHNIPMMTILKQIWRPTLGAVAMALALMTTHPFVPQSGPTLLIYKILLGAAVYTMVCVICWVVFGNKDDIEGEFAKLIKSRLSA